MKLISVLFSVFLIAVEGGKVEVNSDNSTRYELAHRSMSHSISKEPGSSQFLYCYDYTNQGGSSISANDYIPYLGSYNFNNKIESCCFTGIWLLYAESNYNAYSTGSSNWWAFGDNYCTDVPAQFRNKASSLRFTGAPDDWKFDTLNLYFNDYFIGDEEFMYQDTPQLNYDNQAKSLLVTGCNAWTVYQYDYYQGYAMCVYPADTSSCSPGFYSTTQALGSLANQISSAKKGCYAKDKAYPDNHGMKKMGGGESSFNPERI